MSIPPPPPPPPPPGLSVELRGKLVDREHQDPSHTASVLTGEASTSGQHQYMKDAMNPKKEMDYLIEPLFSSCLSCRPVAEHQPTRKVVTFIRDISPVVQKGPMCGLVALTMASELLSLNSSTQGLPTPAHPEAMLHFARNNSLSNYGEMFSVENMLTIATQQLQCCGTAAPIDSLSLRVVVESLFRGKAMLFPYDADKDHSPCLSRGHKAHWCVLVGFAAVMSGNSALFESLECCTQHESNYHYIISDQSKEQLFMTYISDVSVLSDDFYIFARHGKSTHIGLWSYIRLVQSNRNLTEVDPRRSSQDYVTPSGGIRKGLCARALILEPPAAAMTSCGQ